MTAAHAQADAFSAAPPTHDLRTSAWTAGPPYCLGLATLLCLATAGRALLLCMPCLPL
jgi:hypothetical protein